MTETIVAVNDALLKTCPQYTQEIWYNTRALSIFTTAEGSEQFNEDLTQALIPFSQYSPRLGAVARICGRPAPLEDVNDLASCRCGENVVW